MAKGYGIFPRISFKDRGFDATNTLTHIEINPTHPFYAAQLAQERYEFMYKWQTLAYFTIPLLVLFYFVNPWFMPLAIIPAGIYMKRKEFTEDMEIMGHTIETYAASLFYGADYTAYRLSEAHALTSPKSSYYKRGLFRNKTPAEVVDMMGRVINKAHPWVTNRSKTILKDKQKVINL